MTSRSGRSVVANRRAERSRPAWWWSPAAHGRAALGAEAPSWRPPTVKAAAAACSPRPPAHLPHCVRAWPAPARHGGRAQAPRMRLSKVPRASAPRPEPMGAVALSGGTLPAGCPCRGAPQVEVGQGQPGEASGPPGRPARGAVALAFQEQVVARVDQAVEDGRAHDCVREQRVPVLLAQYSRAKTTPTQRHVTAAFPPRPRLPWQARWPRWAWVPGRWQGQGPGLSPPGHACDALGLRRL